MQNDRELRVKACKAYVQAKAERKSNVDAKKIAQAIFKVGHSLCDLSWYAAAENAKGYRPIKPEIAPDMVNEAIVAMRGGEGWDGNYVGDKMAWGPISIALGWFNPADPSTAGENEVQRRFNTATKEVGGEAIAAEGTRSGKGGRWLGDDPTLYVGNHKGIGVEAEKPRQVDREELRAHADEATSKVTAFASKAKKRALRRAKAAQKAAAQNAPKAIEAGPQN